MHKNEFKYFSQEFDNKVLDLVKQKGFYPNEYTSDFEKFKEEFASKIKFYSSLISKKVVIKKYKHVFKVYDKFEMKVTKDYHYLYLKYDVLLLAG